MNELLASFGFRCLFPFFKPAFQQFHQWQKGQMGEREQMGVEDVLCHHFFSAEGCRLQFCIFCQTLIDSDRMEWTWTNGRRMAPTFSALLQDPIQFPWNGKINFQCIFGSPPVIMAIAIVCPINLLFLFYLIVFVNGHKLFLTNFFLSKFQTINMLIFYVLFQFNIHIGQYFH